MSQRSTLEHVLACFNTMYEVLGSGAPTLTNDAYVVRTYEMARAFGEVALELREYLEDPDVAPLSALAEVLRDALAKDESGAMVLYAVAMLVGPRLLVTLRDERESGEWSEREHALFNDASAVVIKEILSVGEVAKDQSPPEDEDWQGHARGLADALDAGGNAESFPVSH